MKRVMIYAYTQFNLGDDLFIKVLCERYPKTNFVLHAPKRYKECFNSIHNLTIIANDSLIIRGINYLFKKINIYQFSYRFLATFCDLSVYIGGSLFMQQRNWQEHFKKQQSLKQAQKAFFLLGANFGPYDDPLFYASYKKLFQRYTDICFRDSYSYTLFNDLPNVRMADDIIFQLQHRPVPACPSKRIAISVIDPANRHAIKNYEKVYYDKLAAITCYFIEKGYQVTLMSFCEYEGDAKAIKKITEQIPETYLYKVTAHFYKTNIEETLTIIAESDFIVATRFHAMILGWLFGKPVFPITYSSKMTNVMEDAHFQGTYSDFRSLKKLTPEIVFDSMEKNKLDVTKQIKNSAKQFTLLDQWLK